MTLGQYGREGVNLNAQNGTLPDYLIGPVTSGTFYIGQSMWAPPYSGIRTANVILKAVDVVAGVSDSDKEGIRGFTQTLQALEFLALAAERDTFGIPIDVDQPTTGSPPPIASKANAYGHVFQLLDQAKTHLQSAGTAFPFTLTSGFAGFDAPATFLTVNRALRARGDVYISKWSDALTDLSGSFLATGASLSLGVWHVFTTNSGDETNLLFARTAYWAHPNLLGAAQLKADGTKDQRVQTKLFIVPTASYLGDTSNVQFVEPSSPTAPLPMIRNEELILLRAEANIGLGNTSAAIQDINLIRTKAGGLLPISDPYVAGPGMPATLLDELLYEKRYSLVWEWGHTWLDLRRYGKLSSLPRDRPSHHIIDVLPFPLDECLARTPQPAGCATVTGY